MEAMEETPMTPWKQQPCEQRMQCKISAYVVGAHGPSQGSATLTLAPKSKGAAAQQSYVMKIKDRFGTGTVSRECKSI